jgi:hypothetical protein
MKAKMTSTSDDAGVVLTHWNCKAAPGRRPTLIMAVTPVPRLRAVILKSRTKSNSLLTVRAISLRGADRRPRKPGRGARGGEPECGDGGRAAAEAPHGNGCRDRPPPGEADWADRPREAGRAGAAELNVPLARSVPPALS